MKYKIAIVEDDNLILVLLNNFLTASGKFEEIDNFNDGKSFLQAIDNIQHQLQAIILDFKLGDINAEMILKELQLKEVKTPVLILTSHYNQYLMGYMIRAGAAAYLPKNIQPDELIVILEEVIQKGHYISPEQFPYLKIAFSEDTLSQSKQVMDLVERDIEVIYLLANQLTAREIAEKLNVSPKTVEGYKNALFSKTGTKTVVGLIVFAIQNGLINASAVDLE